MLFNLLDSKIYKREALMIAETLRVYYFLYSQFYLYLFENISLFIVLFVTHILSFKV